MHSKRSRGPWRAVKNTIRKHALWEVRNTHRDPVAVIYTGQADAELMAASLRLLAALKALACAKPYSAAYVAALNAAQALVDELN